MTRYEHLRKINKQGDYQPFPGITVVAGAFNKNATLCRELYQCLMDCKILGQYYAPLPFESYHMTAFGVYTQRHDGGEDWNRFVDNKLGDFQKMNHSVNNELITPRIAFNELSVSGSISLKFNLSCEQEDLISNLAYEYGFSEQLPPAFHITLAYQYKPMTAHVLEGIQSEITSKISQLMQHQTELVLDPFRLCYFENMKAFLPWDGKNNPFITPHTSVFFQQKIAPTVIPESQTKSNSKNLSKAK